jgi:hypothetical protein
MMSSFVINEHTITYDEEIKGIRQSSIYIIYHDAYEEWQVLTDNLRQTEKGCRFEGWGETIPEAFVNRKLRQPATEAGG